MVLLLSVFLAGCGREDLEQGPQPLTVTSVTPVNGADGISLNTTVTATFSLAMAPATLNTATFIVTGPGGAAVAGTVGLDGATATFTPTSPLAANALFVGTITTGAEDLAGNALAANFVWTFTTNVAATLAPTIVPTLPANGASAVAINTTVNATFSSAMDAATITAPGTFTLAVTAGGAAVPGAVTYDAATNTAIFTPTANLAAGTQFTATITTAAKDAMGSALAANSEWTFTTNVAPTVMPTAPANGAAAVAVNTTVAATFSRAMNAATITPATFTLTGPGEIAVTGAVTYAGSTATFTPAAILAASAVYTATITTGAKDPTGNALATNFVWTFTTDVAPTVVSTVPANGAAAVAVNTAVTATFSRAMAATTITAATFTVTGPGGTAVAGAVTYAGSTATFTPTAVLAGNTLYTAAITAGAKDPTGNALAANFVWTFTTTSLPSVTSTNPVSVATNVPVNQIITATFNQPMNSATITAAGTFTLAVTAGGAAVTGAVTYDGASNTAIFTPTANLATGTQFTAAITTAAQSAVGGALASNYVWTFTTNVAPTVVSTVPVNGASAVAVNTTVAATFSRAMAATTITAATFTVTGPGGTAVAGAVTYAGSTATFTPTAILAANTLYTATITTAAKDPTGSALAANSVWIFTTDLAPAVVSTVPANGSSAVAVNTTIAATFNRAMDSTTINGSTFQLTGPGTTPVAGAVTYAGVTATFTPTTILAANTLYTATITTAAKDPTGNALAANSVWTFTTDLAPTVVSTVPANGAFAVAVNTTVTATFSRAMDSTTINGSTFQLTGPGATSVAGEVTYAGITATFTPTAVLAPNTLYTATITAGAKDPTGNALAANFVWTFTTTSQPSVTSTNPVNAATNVPVNQIITATFNQPMNSATITAAGTFTLAVTAGGAAVTGVVTYDGASNTAIFTPTANLAASSQYTATITTAAQSAADSGLASNYVWTFTTGAVVDATAPTVTSTNPASATLVPLNQKIAATFSEAMDPATISAAGTVTVVVTAGGAAVSGIVRYDTVSRTVVFDPAANLAASTQYTVTISSAARDLSGNALTTGTVPNPWDFTTGTLLNSASPTITFTNPASGATSVPIDKTINATFSAPMDPTTINNASFTVSVAGVGGAAVDGTVSYDVASQIATFTPSANLATGTQYTATISNSVQDLSGNALAAGLVPNPWNFTTGPTVGAGPNAVDLGSVSLFAGLGGSVGMTNVGVLTQINGDIGTTGASTTVTGFHDAGPGCTYIETTANAGLVNGLIYTAPPIPTAGCPSEGTGATFAIASQALADANAAYNILAAISGGLDPGVGQLGGLVLAPGVYTSGSGAFLISGSDLTLDGQGDVNAVWVFQMTTSLTVGATGAPRSVNLINGAQAKNVFWQVGSAATINASGGGTMVGTIIASAGVAVSTAGNTTISTLNGRALGLTAPVTMTNTNINLPAP
jgi:ketosteroid isomerase-like protein